MKRIAWTKLVAGVVVAMLLFGAAGAWLAPGIVKRAIEEQGGKTLGRTLSIDAISINPYTLRVKIAGLAIKSASGGHFFSVEEIDAGASWMSVLRLVPVIDFLNIVQPKISIARLAPNRYDFSDIVERLQAQSKKEPSAPLAFVLNHLSIERASLDFDDWPEKTRHELRDLRLVLPFISSIPRDAAVDVLPALTAKFNGMAVDLSGKLTPFRDPLGASLKLDFKNLDLTRYVEYVPFALNYKVASGSADGVISIDLASDKAKGTTLSARGQMTLSKLDLREQSNAPLLSLAQMAVDIEKVDAFNREVALKSVAIEGLDISMKRRAGGFNLDVLKPPAPPSDQALPAGEKAGAAVAAKAVVFSLAELTLKGGRLDFQDETVTPHFNTRLQGITLSGTGLGTQTGSKAAVELALTTQAGETLSSQASVSLAPFLVDAKITAEKIGLATYAPYLAPYLTASLAGVLSGGANLHLAGGEGGMSLALSTVTLRAANLLLSREGTELARLATLNISAAEIDTVKRTVTAVELGVNDGRVAIARDADGQINLTTLLPPVTTPPSTAAPAVKANPWNIDLKKAQLDAIAIGFVDASVTPAVKLELAPLSLTAEGLSTRAGVQGRLAAKFGLNRAGNVEVSGPVSLEPLAGKLAVNAQNLGIVAFQPYFRRFINALVTAGGLSAKGELQIRSGAGGVLADYAGDAGISAFTLMDAEATQPLVTFKSLQLEGIRAASQPAGFSVGPVTLSEFYSRIVVQSDGRINLQNIIPPKAAAKAEISASDKPATVSAAPKTAEATAAIPGDTGSPVRIGRFVLQAGTVEFSDQSVKPNFSLRATELGGSIAGLSDDPATRAEVALKGLVGGNAPLDISGTVNPLSGNLFFDMKATAKGIDLNPMTPYAARYAGYGIEKGKLSVDLAYRVENRKLDARHKIFIDQLTLGAPVASPEATKLPVLLVLALLKNSRGEIDIELPIGGSLDDPEFSFGAIIGKVILNLMVKVITAPFALLGAIFGGGGEELSFIEFDSGLASLGAAQVAKLQNLAKALTDRNGLRLEIAGRTEAVSDRDGLKRETLKQKVRAQKVAATVGQGTEVKTATEIQVTPAEYADFLKRAYDRETFEKPRNAIGIARTLPVDEMEKLILNNTEIGEQSLRDLAARRAEAVRDWMMKTGSIGIERLFLVAPREETGAEEGRAKARGNRVDMYIR